MMANERFLDIQEAYEHLTDPIKKARYDSKLDEKAELERLAELARLDRLAQPPPKEQDPATVTSHATPHSVPTRRYVSMKMRLLSFSVWAVVVALAVLGRTTGVTGRLLGIKHASYSLPRSAWKSQYKLFDGGFVILIVLACVVAFFFLVNELPQIAGVIIGLIILDFLYRLVVRFLETPHPMHVLLWTKSKGLPVHNLAVSAPYIVLVLAVSSIWTYRLNRVRFHWIERGLLIVALVGTLFAGELFLHGWWILATAGVLIAYILLLYFFLDPLSVPQATKLGRNLFHSPVKA